jgi:hypothetical protein
MEMKPELQAEIETYDLIRKLQALKIDPETYLIEKCRDFLKWQADGMADMPGQII